MLERAAKKVDKNLLCWKMHCKTGIFFCLYFLWPRLFWVITESFWIFCSLSCSLSCYCKHNIFSTLVVHCFVAMVCYTYYYQNLPYQWSFYLAWVGISILFLGIVISVHVDIKRSRDSDLPAAEESEDELDDGSDDDTQSVKQHRWIVVVIFLLLFFFLFILFDILFVFVLSNT